MTTREPAFHWDQWRHTSRRAELPALDLVRALSAAELRRIAIGRLELEVTRPFRGIAYPIDGWPIEWIAEANVTHVPHGLCRLAVVVTVVPWTLESCTLAICHNSRTSSPRTLISRLRLLDLVADMLLSAARSRHQLLPPGTTGSSGSFHEAQTIDRIPAPA
jgi:hypothetical protein